MSSARNLGMVASDSDCSKSTKAWSASNRWRALLMMRRLVSHWDALRTSMRWRSASNCIAAIVPTSHRKVGMTGVTFHEIAESLPPSEVVMAWRDGSVPEELLNGLRAWKEPS